VLELQGYQLFVTVLADMLTMSGHAPAIRQDAMSGLFSPRAIVSITYDLGFVGHFISFRIKII